jgi:hypothetical protein
MANRATMDIQGAEALRWRLAQQEHWQTAAAVRSGAQPAIDPEGYALERFGEGVRVYRVRRRRDVVHGRSAMVTFRFSKRLVDGAWHEQVVVEDVQDAA